MKKNGIDFNAYTALTSPCFFSGIDDVEHAVDISELIGVRHSVVDVDMTKIDISDIDVVIEKMPLVAHLSVLFLALTKEISKDGIKKVWCGQNADSLYNFGPSGRFSFNFNGFMDVFRRYCISEGFLKSFKDTKGYNPICSKFNLTIAQIGLKEYNKLKSSNLVLPKSAEELTYNFLASRDYTIFGNTNNEYPHGTKKSEAFEWKNQMYTYKIEHFLKEAAPLIVDTACQINEIPSFILPYSSEYMLPVFQNIHLTMGDLFKPKKYIYRYIKEFSKEYGKEICNFKDIDPKTYKGKYGNVMDIHKVYENIMENTEFGKMLGDNKKKPSGYTGVQFLTEALSKYWIKRVKYLLEAKYECRIINSKI